ncbi:hypothetical protein YC2023_006943 [Brassica napus]
MQQKMSFDNLEITDLLRGFVVMFTKSKNGISRSINQMMYSMLRFGYPKWSVIPSDERELWFRQFAQEFNWHSDLTETVRKKFNEKAMDSYTKQINAWKTNTTILSENATIRSENATILAELAFQKKFNTEIMQKLDRLMSSSSS